MSARPSVLALLLRTDLRKLGRDPVLLGVALVPVLLAALLRFALPTIERELLPLGVDLQPHRPILEAGAVLLSAMMPGWIVGFFLLEERVQRTLLALAVTPLTLRGFVAWRLALPGLLALLGGALVLGVGGSSLPGPLPTTLALLLAAACAPMFALFLVGYADSEVEGLALGKIGGLAFVLPIVALYFNGPITWIGGLLPPYWVARIYAGGPPWMIVPGLLSVGLWLIPLLRRFAARID